MNRLLAGASGIPLHDVPAPRYITVSAGAGAFPGSAEIGRQICVMAVGCSASRGLVDRRRPAPVQRGRCVELRMSDPSNLFDVLSET
jgi:hypothetical protein